MKFMRVYTGDDGESHLEELSPEFTDREGTRTAAQDANGISFAHRADGSFIDFHQAPRDQYVLYLTASVEVGLVDGSSMVMEPGDVLLANDTTGRGHTSRVVTGGLCAFVPLGE